MTDPTGATRYMEYDERNRLIAVRNENGHRRRMVYDLDGRLAAEIDPNGNATTFEYDQAGRLIARSNALEHVTSFRYDGVGNLVGVTSPRANANPGLGLVNSLGESESRTYDELGKILTNQSVA